MCIDSFAQKAIRISVNRTADADVELGEKQETNLKRQLKSPFMGSNTLKLFSHKRAVIKVPCQCHNAEHEVSRLELKEIIYIINCRKK